MVNKSRDRTLFRAIWLARAAVVLLTLMVAIVLDNTATETYRAEVRQDWQTQLHDISLNLQSTILQNVQTVWGLAANVSVQPNITEAEFQGLASVIFALAPQLRNIGLAPDLTISNIYPLEGNEAALGLDLTQQSLSEEQTQTLKESRRALFNGPIKLVQGGQGMAARIPIFENDSGRFWGVISVILDLDRLYNVVGMQSFSETGDLALFEVTDPARINGPFFGDTTTQWQDPVATELNMPGINWTLLAQPDEGWPSHPESPVLVRLLLVLMVLIISAGSFWLTSLLLRDHQMQRRFWGLFELAPFGIGLYSAEDGTLLRANNSFEKLFGSKANALDFFEAIYSPSGEALSEGLDIPGKLRKDLRFSGLEGYFHGSNDDLSPILLHGLTVDTENGQPVIWLIAEDISEQKKADRAKSEFISIVSHELRTPLTSIAGSMGLLANNAAGELPPKASRLAEIAYRNTRQLTALINDLLDIEKLVAGKMVLNITDCPIKEIVHESLESLETFSIDKRVTLVATQLHDVSVKADRGRLHQALNNLLSNAMKFSPEDSEVTVYSEKSENEIRIFVSDQGLGIPAKLRESIFEKFSQADSSDRRVKGGTGLGLAITRQLMRAMGGEVGFDSEEGSGACFWLSLPLGEADTQGAT